MSLIYETPYSASGVGKSSGSILMQTKSGTRPSNVVMLSGKDVDLVVGGGGNSGGLNMRSGSGRRGGITSILGGKHYIAFWAWACRWH